MNNTLPPLLTLALVVGIPEIVDAQVTSFRTPSISESCRTPQNRNPNIVLLRKMIHPTADFVGEQKTEVTEYGGRTSVQKVYGDSKARMRREYIAPNSLQGDIMITAPNRYLYYHHRTNVLDIALWPSEETGRQRRLMQMVMQGHVSVERLGNERIAGRDAVILQIVPKQQSVNARHVKFWIDPETGIQLKNEISNAKGLLSRTYFTSLVVGGGSLFAQHLFEAPSFPKMTPNPLLPPQPQYQNLDEAQGKLPFQPHLPTALPKGFQLTGVWSIFPAQMGPQRPAVILRYGDGVESFTLFERLMPDPIKRMGDATHPLRRGESIVHWVIYASGGKTLGMTYIGHLPQEQVDAFIASIR